LNDENVLISSIVFSVAQLKPTPSASDSLSDSGSATGFFYERNNRLFLITCKHVLLDEGHIPTKLTMKLHIKDSKDLSELGVLSFNLYDEDRAPIWFENDRDDIAIIALDKNQITSVFNISAFSSKNHLPEDALIVPAEDVFLIGYPLGFFDKSNNLPIFRHANIASHFGVPYGGDQIFLTDGKLHEGLSGAPIVTNPKGPLLDKNHILVLRDGENYFILGVHCGGFKSENMTAKDNTDLGLGRAVYIQIVDRIIDENQKSIDTVRFDSTLLKS